MTTAVSRADAFDHALLQSRVIETGLERLSATMSQADPRLGDELASYRRIFDAYVCRVRDARTLADAAQDGVD